MANAHPNDRRNGPLQTASLVVALVLALTTSATTTLAVARGRDNRAQGVQIEKILVVLENMKAVDAGLVLEIAKVRGESTTEIALINQKIGTITEMLMDIKVLIKERTR